MRKQSRVAISDICRGTPKSSHFSFTILARPDWFPLVKWRVSCDHGNTFSSEVVIRGLVGQALFVLCSILLCIKENRMGRFGEGYFLFLCSDPYQNPHQVPEVNSLWPIRLMQVREVGKMDLYPRYKGWLL